MKLLLDQGIPRTTAAILRESGIDAIHVGEIGYATAEDAEIINKGRLEERVVVTLDADFHALLALSGASSPSVIRIRIEGLRSKAMAALLQQLLNSWQEALTTGAVLTVQKGRVRMRQLPLLP
jgi:predicted nuclease of predicted toxin-antitoxin system